MVVTLKRASLVVTPTVSNVTTPETAEIVKPYDVDDALIALLVPKLIGPVVVLLVTVIELPKVIPLAPAVKTMPEVELVVILPLSMMAPVVVTVR